LTPHMRSASPKTPLEPMAAAFIGVALLHFLAGGVIWGLLPLWKPALPGQKGDTEDMEGRYWFAPADYTREGVVAPALPEKAPVKAANATAVAKSASESKSKEVGETKEYPGTLADNPVQPATAPQPAVVRPTSKIITLSPVLDVEGKEVPLVKSTRPPVTMMDMLKQEKLEEVEKKAAGGADMDPVLKALEEALKQTWNAPSLSDVPVLQRDAKLRIVINRDGGITETKMIKTSGSAVLDETVTQAGASLKKISQSLPSSFPKDRYTVEVNFHIE